VGFCVGESEERVEIELGAEKRGAAQDGGIKLCGEIAVRGSAEEG